MRRARSKSRHDVRGTGHLSASLGRLIVWWTQTLIASLVCHAGAVGLVPRGSLAMLLRPHRHRHAKVDMFRGSGAHQQQQQYHNQSKNNTQKAAAPFRGEKPRESVRLANNRKQAALNKRRGPTQDPVGTGKTAVADAYTVSSKRSRAVRRQSRDDVDSDSVQAPRRRPNNKSAQNRENNASMDFEVVGDLGDMCRWKWALRYLEQDDQFLRPLAAEGWLPDASPSQVPHPGPWLSAEDLVKLCMPEHSVPDVSELKRDALEVGDVKPFYVPHPLPGPIIPLDSDDVAEPSSDSDDTVGSPQTRGTPERAPLSSSPFSSNELDVLSRSKCMPVNAVGVK